jgi:hypothetical protein
VIANFPRFVDAIRENIVCKPYPVLRPHLPKLPPETKRSTANSYPTERDVPSRISRAPFFRFPDLEALCFYIFMNPSFRKSFVFTSICVARGCGGYPAQKNNPALQRSSRKISKSIVCHTSEKCTRNPSVCHTSEKPGGWGARAERRWSGIRRR